MSRLSKLAVAIVLALGPAGACSHTGDAPAVSAGIAGKVVELTGKVTVQRGDAVHALAAGEGVEGGDVVDTGADGHVVIVLAHNHARWELGPGQHKMVKDSLAWNEPARDGSAQNVDENSAAAGRPAERNAAETTAGAAPAPAAVAPPAAEPAAAQAAKADVAADRADSEAAPAKKAAAPAAPERSRAATAKSEAATAATGAPGGAIAAPGGVTNAPVVGGSVTGGVHAGEVGSLGTASGGGAAGTTRGGGTHAPARTARDQVRGRRAELLACLPADVTSAKLVVVVDATGHATTTLTSASKLAPSVVECATAIIAKLPLPNVAANVTLDLTR